VRVSEYDPYLTVLTTAQVSYLRELVTASLEAREVTVREFVDDAVVTDDDQVYGLWNLSASLDRDDLREWPAAVDHHFQRLLTATSQPEAISAADLDVLLPRLVGRESVLPATHPNAPEISPGLWLVLSLNRTDEVVIPAEDELAVLGEPESLWTTAWANLRSLTAATEFETLGLERGVHLVGSLSFYTATMAMFVDELLRAAELPIDHHQGVLVAVPSRDVVVVGPVGAAVEVTEMTAALVGAVAEDMFGQEPGPLSPLVHWVHRGRWTPVAGPDEQGELMIDLPEALRRLLTP